MINVEKEWLMTPDVAYERLDRAIYNHSACPETAHILYLYLEVMLSVAWSTLFFYCRSCRKFVRIFV